MSHHPLTHDEQRRIAEKMKRRKKPVESVPMLPPVTVIFSEGTKTEPNYIKELADRVNTKYAKYSSKPRIYVFGTGRNTRGLYAYAKGKVKTDYPNAEIVWLMFDKDDFPFDDFDNVIRSTQASRGHVKFKSAWSNECLEIWFMLHFNYHDTNNGREWYQKKLSQYLGFKYDKSYAGMFSLLEDKLEVAIRNAKRLIDNTLPPSRNVPATNVYELVEELRNYLE